MGVSARRVGKLRSGYKDTPPEEITYPPRTGRPVRALPGRREHPAVPTHCTECRRVAVRPEEIIKESTGTHVAHGAIQAILKDEEPVENRPGKAKRRKWVRYERRLSNPVWHTDYKQLPDGRWLVSC